MQLVSIQISHPDNYTWDQIAPSYHYIEKAAATIAAQVVANATGRAVRLTYLPDDTDTANKETAQLVGRISGHYFHPKQ